MKLKQYQLDTLAILRRYLESARVAGPGGAYNAIVREEEQARRLGRYAGDYRALNNLAHVPYVCLRLPTGGGKTILAAHSVAIARDAWMERDYPLVLWLVTSNVIRAQTVDALKDASHPYREGLNEAFGGRVRVFDIGDFNDIRPHDLRDNACIVVATIQTLRVANTEGRKVYAHNENMEPHFTGVAPNAPGLETSDDGKIKFSFANLLHLQRPLMIVDEAHNAVTGLSRDVQERVNPTAIIEFTATPRTNSNILHSVSAQELKDAQMIKLPIMLSEHQNWQSAVNGAVAARESLADKAKDDVRYIRPIVLFQAESRDKEVNVDVLKKHLIETEQIDPEKIAVATGDQRELDGIDLFDPACPIEYVITMEALKEGWDCSFAYVFCSVANIRSATAVEQLLGRVLRMPYAERRKAEELNRAHAHVSEPSFEQAARGLVDKLIAMGFEDEEAEANVVSQTEIDLRGGLFAPRAPSGTFRQTLKDSPALRQALEQRPGASFRATDGGNLEITVEGLVAPDLGAALEAAVDDAEREAFRASMRQYAAEIEARRAPADRGEPFVVPRLMAHVQGELDFADTDLLMECHDWSLLDHPARLEANEFTVHETANTFSVDLNGNKLEYHFAGEDEQLSLNIPLEGWTPENLTLWLDRQARQADINQVELVSWLRKMVDYLTGPRGLPISSLMRAKFILARKARERIDAARKSERARAYQQYLFAPEARVEVSFDSGFEFRAGMYDGQKMHRGGRATFQKHFLGPDQVPSFDGADDGEEIQCARMLDSLPEVDFWLRNVSQHQASFWLPTSTDKFYPDFVAKLRDGRMFVVEYKGADRFNNDDTNEKRTIGRLWETASKGLFLVVGRTVDGLDMRAQMKAKVA